MLFTTLSFLVFFAVVYLVFWAMPMRFRLYWMLVASVLFYAAWSIPFALHFLGIVWINYILVRRMFFAREQKRKRLFMRLAVGLNMANLFLFKYFYLFLRFLHDLSGLGVFAKGSFNGWLYRATGYDELILPLAISFYTFQLVALVVDYYRGLVIEEPRPLRFFVFILFFPQLIAGPIMRHSDFMDQLKEIRPREDYLQRGMYLVLLGLIKKVVIADNLIAPIAPVFEAPGSFDSLSNWMAVLGFSVQVYMDFSGYTDMARGLAFLLGLKLPRNFRAPYLATSCRDLWTRWHITLSTWLRDYIYFPLGGNRRGRMRTYINLFVTFTLGGLWHGANYTYIAWGAMHGLALAVERFMREFFGQLRTDGFLYRFFSRISKALSQLPALQWMLGVFYTYLIFLFGVVFFRAPDIGRAFAMFGKIFSFAAVGQALVYNEFLFGMTLVSFAFNWVQTKKDAILYVPERHRYWVLALSVVLVMLVVERYAPSGSEYIYFRF